MKNTFLKTNLSPLKSPAGLFWNILTTLFILGSLILVTAQILNINFEAILDPFELLKQTWYLFALGYFLKFIWLYFGAKRVNKMCAWLGVFPELMLFIDAFVIFYFTGDVWA